MNKKKGADKIRGPPQRKSIAGPSILGTFTAPGAIKKTVAYDSVGKPGISDTTGTPMGVYAPKLPDYTNIDGRIKILHVIDVRRELLCCKYNEEFDYLAAGCSDGSIAIYDSVGGEYILTLIDDEVEIATAPVTAIQHRPVSKSYPINNCFTCTYANGFVKCWNYNFRQCLYTIKESRECFGITYHPRYPKFVTYGDDAKIYFYDEESKTQERVLSSSNNPKVTDGHTSRVFSTCFNPRSNYELISGGWDDVVHFWDLRQPHSIRHISGVHVCGEGLDINFKGTEVLTCAFQSENPFRVWDYGSGKLIGGMSQAEACKLYVGKFIGKDMALCGGTSPNTFRVVDLSTYVGMAGVMGLPSAVYSVDVGPSKKGKDANQLQRNDFALIPQIAFVSGKKLYQIDFY